MDMRVRSTRERDIRGCGFLTGDGVAAPIESMIWSARNSSVEVGGLKMGIGGSNGGSGDGEVSLCCVVGSSGAVISSIESEADGVSSGAGDPSRGAGFTGSDVETSSRDTKVSFTGDFSDSVDAAAAGIG
jgi:hypothetical protein